MSLPIDMMREFCVRHKLGEEAMEEIMKIVDVSLIQAGRKLLLVAPAAKKPAAKKKPAADRCKCEGKNKKGEPCRFYALEGKKHCKSHQVLESGSEPETTDKPKRKKLVSKKAEEEYLGGIKKVVLEFFEENKGKKLSELKFSIVRKFVAEKGIEVTSKALLQDITKEVIQDLKLSAQAQSQAQSQPDEDPETDDE